MIASVEICFWICVAGIVYAYVGYPILIGVAARVVGQSSEPRTDSACNCASLPEVSVLIAAFNAEPFICQRIANILACDYPPQRLKVVVASDGSTDRTVPLVEQYCDSRVTVLAFPEREGKAKTLVKAVSELTSEVVLFTDASTFFERDSVRRLLSHFLNSEVGLVTGHIAVVDRFGKPAESLYWRCEMLIRRAEAKLGIMLGASGAIYAIRRKFFVDPKQAVINDDLVLPTLAQLRHHFPFTLDESAKAFALDSGNRVEEFRRRVRIGAGSFQSVSILKEMFQVHAAKTAFAFLSHKFLRWLCPSFLICALLCNLLLSYKPAYQILLTMQLVGIGLAILGFWTMGVGKVGCIARALNSFYVMNAALLVGQIRWWLAPQNAVWTPTRRPVMELAENVMVSRPATASQDEKWAA